MKKYLIIATFVLMSGFFTSLAHAGTFYYNTGAYPPTVLPTDVKNNSNEFWCDSDAPDGVCRLWLTSSDYQHDGTLISLKISENQPDNLYSGYTQCFDKDENSGPGWSGGEYTLGDGTVTYQHEGIVAWLPDIYTQCAYIEIHPSNGASFQLSLVSAPYPITQNDSFSFSLATDTMNSMPLTDTHFTLIAGFFIFLCSMLTVIWIFKRKI